MSLLLSQLDGLLTVVQAVATSDGTATVVGVGANQAAHGGVRQSVRKVYEVDPPNRFWPKASIHTY